jgi:ABC-type multidrug transport system ATPase subunit
MCTRVLWLHHGQLVADGEPDHIIEDYRRLMRLRRQERRNGGKSGRGGRRKGRRRGARAGRGTHDKG